ncbi:MAG: sn-glycerol-1-phosphate dehydrogenase, partial [Lentisphaerae bacterium]|nr:sn-glycerol-1-phosphate dehydrogenase [Lentisphaerota bacterium]
AAGYADLVAKVTAGADWIIADQICGDIEPILEIPWRMVQHPLESWINRPFELKNGDSKAFAALFEGLTLSGFAMQAADSSRPASGCEHMFSHIWEMSGVKKEDGTAPSHGFMVGIGTLTATVIMDSFFSKPFTHSDIEEALLRYPAWEERENMIRGLFGEGELFNKILDECRVKHLEKDALAERLALIADSFEELHERVGRQLMPVPRLREMLRVAGCPSTTEEIGITPQRCAATTIAAQMLRSRYTVLDLVYETGRLHEAVTDVASFWDD